ncbi:hypothetical protein RF11_04112 [Thelohanellus kitauei]|uniref:Reverse transcriptase/retrotransposon-derived protein RNase H-like domain-containing protein n=1 Tax=Thelohanellus kitauei TaxID=669202 RepID=A0A0C2IKA5_THEKT|nr:hypothetical protein RF11_04112 [Thelohanellus kitauei]
MKIKLKENTMLRSLLRRHFVLSCVLLRNDLLASPTTFVHYDQNKELLLQTDAGAVLLQKDAKGEERPIAYASRTLSTAEQNYSTNDKKALAIVFGSNKIADTLLRFPNPEAIQSIEDIAMENVNESIQQSNFDEILDIKALQRESENDKYIMIMAKKRQVDFRNITVFWRKETCRHPGIVAMKSLSKRYVRWPGLNIDNEILVNGCTCGQENRYKPSDNPIYPCIIREKPWYGIHVDYNGPDRCFTCKGTKEEDEKLMNVLITIRNTIHRATYRTLSEMMFNMTFRNVLDNIKPNIDQHTNKVSKRHHNKIKNNFRVFMSRHPVWIWNNVTNEYMMGTIDKRTDPLSYIFTANGKTFCKHADQLTPSKALTEKHKREDTDEPVLRRSEPLKQKQRIFYDEDKSFEDEGREVWSVYTPQ